MLQSVSQTKEYNSSYALLFAKTSTLRSVSQTLKLKSTMLPVFSYLLRQVRLKRANQQNQFLKQGNLNKNFIRYFLTNTHRLCFVEYCRIPTTVYRELGFACYRNIDRKHTLAVHDTSSIWARFSLQKSSFTLAKNPSRLGIILASYPNGCLDFGRT